MGCRSAALGHSAHDPDLVASPYAEDCEFRSHPFREPLIGREGARRYAKQAFAEERSAVSSFADPIAAPDGPPAVEYRATITAIDERTTTLSGVTILRFDADGLVAQHRDCWSMDEA